jgi:hypothetical protein
MTDWSLPVLLASLHEDIQQRLATVRKSFGHPGTMGDASERVWIEHLDKYLPRRYQATAHIVDSLGKFSQQIDVVVFDRQYSPFIFNYESQTIIPAESVYAVFEAKQTANAALVAYAQEKVATSNAWAEFAAVFSRTRSAHLEHEQAKTELKGLVPEDARQAIGHGIRAKRSKSGAISFDLLDAEGSHATNQ